MCLLVRLIMFRRVIVAFTVLLMSVWCNISLADIIGVTGVSVDGKVYCPGDEGKGIVAPPKAYVKLSPRSCTLRAVGYVAESGDYRVELFVVDIDEDGMRLWSNSQENYIDATKPVEQQIIKGYHDSGQSSWTSPSYKTLALCYQLVGQNVIAGYLLYETLPGATCNPGYGPLPPAPVPQPVSCKINNGNSLSVNLGTFDRAVMPTVPGSGQMQTAQFPVTCTNGSASMKMQLNYTPVSVSGTQVVNSSVNGVGVAVSYNDKILSPSDVTTMQLAQGTTNVTLKFGAVRNPSVAVSDIKTGPFTASAVLVMTQQ
ncbi:fimbrial protein [Cronobacter muytjensii]